MWTKPRFGRLDPNRMIKFSERSGLAAMNQAATAHLDPELGEGFVHFDFGPKLPNGVGIEKIVSVTSRAVINLAGFAAPPHQLGEPSLTRSTVRVWVGKMTPRITYSIRCVVLGSDGLERELRKILKSE